MAAASGYTRAQIALHWFAALLIAQQFLFTDAISDAWEAARTGLESAFSTLVLAHVAGGALVIVFALWRLTIGARRGAQAVAGDSAVQRGRARDSSGPLRADDSDARQRRSCLVRQGRGCRTGPQHHEGCAFGAIGASCRGRAYHHAC